MLFENLEFISEFYNKFSGRGEIPYRRLKSANLAVFNDQYTAGRLSKILRPTVTVWMGENL